MRCPAGAGNGTTRPTNARQRRPGKRNSRNVRRFAAHLPPAIRNLPARTRGLAIGAGKRREPTEAGAVVIGSPEVAIQQFKTVHMGGLDHSEVAAVQRGYLGPFEPFSDGGDGHPKWSPPG